MTTDAPSPATVEDISRGFDAGNYAHAYESEDLDVVLEDNAEGETQAYRDGFILGFFSSYELTEIPSPHYDTYVEAACGPHGQIGVKLGWFEDPLEEPEPPQEPSQEAPELVDVLLTEAAKNVYHKALNYFERPLFERDKRGVIIPGSGISGFQLSLLAGKTKHWIDVAQRICSLKDARYTRGVTDPRELFFVQAVPQAFVSLDFCYAVACACRFLMQSNCRAEDGTLLSSEALQKEREAAQAKAQAKKEDK